MKSMWWILGGIIVILIVGVLLARSGSAPAPVSTPSPVTAPEFTVPEAEGLPTPPDTILPAVSPIPAGGGITSKDFSFAPAALTAAPGAEMVLNVQNSGVHTFTIDGVVNTPLSGPTAAVRFTAPTKAGTYEYYCAIPGHKERGMVGTLTVR